MHALTAVVALLAASPALAQPAVSLLTDFSGYPKSGTVNLRSVLSKVAERKGAPFRFGSTYDTSHPNQSWLTNVFNTVFNHVVAENGCKWQSTEQTRGQPSLTACKGVQSFASSRGASFRGHNTFWHAQTPSWLPGSFSCSDLVNSIIPTNVKNTISGLGSSVTSWDVTNEIVGDGVSNGMSAFQCISNKNVWPTSGNKCTNTDFARAAFKQALATASSNTRLVLNDYNTGGNDAKTACQFAVLADIVASGVPYNRTSIGFQTHQSTSGFYSKAALKANLQKLQGLGAHGLLTEIDIAVSSTASNQLRYQAAIWGDYLDACLYASNCFEFINWNPRDDMSWLGTGKSGTLHDSSGNPKLVLYELWARFTRYANGEAELCATALGTGSCMASGPGGSTNPPTSTSNIITTTSTNGGTCAALYGQCGGDGYTGPTCCAQGTCKYSNQWYSQCLN